MTSPRVLHIITRLDSGGSATNTIASVDLLRNHGFQTALAYGVTNDPGGSITASLDEKEIRHFNLSYLVRPPALVKDLLALSQIRRLLKKERFDLVHTHSSKAGVLGRLAAKASGVPAVHTPHGHIFYGYFGTVPTKLFVLVERWMARYASRIISLTDIETAESLEKGIGKLEQYVTIHSGVPLSKFRGSSPELRAQFRKSMNIPQDSFLFVSVGRLVPVKGFDILLKGFATADFSNRPVFLAIIGDGDQRQPLQSAVGELGISERVKFTGKLEDAQIPLASADAFVLASRNEGMGRAFIEAMASGLPVIGTAVGGIPSILKDGKNGFLVPAENPGALARAMKKLAAHPELCKTMGNYAADFVYPEYDEKTMIERLAGVYREVLGHLTVC